MKSSIFSSAAGLAFASSAIAASDSGCAAQNIMDACLTTTRGYLSLCNSQDYSCLCDKYTSIMTCYNNCPGDPSSSADGNSKQLYCMNASLYSTNSKAAATATDSTTSTTVSGTEVSVTSTPVTTDAPTSDNGDDDDSSSSSSGDGGSGGSRDNTSGSDTTSSANKAAASTTASSSDKKANEAVSADSQKALIGAVGALAMFALALL